MSNVPELEWHSCSSPVSIITTKSGYCLCESQYERVSPSLLESSTLDTSVLAGLARLAEAR
jgi:hypothetical protein